MNSAKLIALTLILPVCGLADDDFKMATVIGEETLLTTAAAAPDDRVSDQPVVHVESAEGRLGIGIVHRPVIAPGGPIRAIQHHNQSEVYRVMAGAGILVTSGTMAESVALDSDGYVVKSLTGPSDTGVKRTDSEGNQLVLKQIHPDNFRCDVAIPDSDKRPPHSRSHEVERTVIRQEEND